jgi:hypothetical protein
MYHYSNYYFTGDFDLAQSPIMKINQLRTSTSLSTSPVKLRLQDSTRIPPRQATLANTSTSLSTSPSRGEKKEVGVVVK